MHDMIVDTTALLVLLAWGSVGALFFWERFLRDALRRFRRRSRLSQALVALGLAALVAIGGIKPDNTPPAPPLRSAPMTAGLEVTNLMFTAISVSKSNVVLDVAWPTNDPPAGLPPPDGILDLYCVTNLTEHPWALLHTESGATNPPVEFTISGSLVPGWNSSTNSHVHDATCPVVTNVFVSPFDGVTITTNVTYGCDYPPPPAEAGFFRLGTRFDTDGDGVPDAYETMVQGTDPLAPREALADADGDGIPNVYESIHGTDPLSPDWDSAPKYTVGGPGADFATLSDAFSASEPYDILEIQPGVYSGSGWTELEIPVHPVLVTSSGGGKARNALVRPGEPNFLHFEVRRGHHVVVQGLCVELAESATTQAAFWLGGTTPGPGTGCPGLFRNVDVRFGPGGRNRFGWFIRNSSPDPVILSGCVVDAEGASDAKGFSAIDSSELLLENCTFRGFGMGTHESSAIHLESTSSNAGGTTDPIPVAIRNCLFDESFTNAFVLAPLTNGVAYEVAMERCLVPSALDFPPSSEVGTVTAAVSVDRHGHLLSASSPAVGAGTTSRFATHDIDGEPFASPAPIGADEWSDGTETDSDGDGLTNADETTRTLTDPFLPDTDGDGIGDEREDAHGTDPLNPRSFCFHLAVETPWTPPMHPDARLAVASSGTNGAWTVHGDALAAASPTNGVYDFGHVFVTNALPADMRLVFFHDADGDGIPGADEVRTSVPLVFPDHAAAVPLSADGDGDEMPDLWEALHGLNPSSRFDAAGNPDGDGLVNLHEYWAGCDPWTPDGSNTLLSVIATSIDSRIAGVTNAAAVKPMYNNYTNNGAVGIFEKNTNCWAHGIDLSCASLWHVEGPSQEHPGWQHYMQPLTLISPRHAIGAWHARPEVGWHYVFQALDGTMVTNKVTGILGSAATDLMVCRLESEMPESFVPASILPDSYTNYLGRGEGLPVLALDQERKTLAFEVKHLLQMHDNRLFFGDNLLSRYRTPQNAQRAALDELLETGDSGNPVFFLLGDTPILVSCMWARQHGDGPSVVLNSAYIQGLMNQLSNGYTLSIVDLSSYEPLQETP